MVRVYNRRRLHLHRSVLLAVTLVLLSSLLVQAKTTLVVMDWKLNETPATQAWFQQVKEKFEAAHPGVEIEYMPAAFGDAYREKILVGAVAGVVPDVVSLSVIWARELWDAGVLQDLNPYIAVTPDLHPRNFIPATQIYNQVNGSVYGITNAMDVNLLLYNRDILEMAGMSTDPNAIASWDALTTILKKLTVGTGTGQVARYGLNINLNSPGAYSSWLNANGGSFYNGDLTRSALSSKENIETAEFIYDLHRNNLLGGNFAQQTVVMNCGMNSTPYFLDKDAPALNYNVTSFPQGPSGTQRGSTVWGNMYAIPKDSKQSDLAWEFIKYYASLQGNIDIFEALDYVTSPRLDFYRSRQWLSARTRQPWMPLIPEVAYLGGMYPFLQYQKLSQVVWGPLMRPAITGTTAIPGAFAQAAETHNRILAGDLQ